MPTLHAGWFRCRIRGASKSNYPWIYYHVTVVGPKTDLRREARYYAGLYLRRQIFDCESVVCSPVELSSVKVIDHIRFYYDGALAEVPPPIAALANTSTEANREDKS